MFILFNVFNEQLHQQFRSNILLIRNTFININAHIKVRLHGTRQAARLARDMLQCDLLRGNSVYMVSPIQIWPSCCFFVPSAETSQAHCAALGTKKQEEGQIWIGLLHGRQLSRATPAYNPCIGSYWGLRLNIHCLTKHRTTYMLCFYPSKLSIWMSQMLPMRIKRGTTFYIASFDSGNSFQSKHDAELYED